MQFIFVHLNSIKQIHRNEDTISMQSASSFLNDSDHKNNNTFLFFFLQKPLKAEGEQSMHHCTHLHSIFYPACLVECYTYSIYRGKNRKGQISRKENVHLWVSFSAEAVMSLPRWLWPGSRRGCDSMAKPSLGTRRSDKQICWELRSPRPTVWSLNGCFHLLSVALYSSRVHTIAPPDSLPVLLLCNLTDFACVGGEPGLPPMSTHLGPEHAFLELAFLSVLNAQRCPSAPGGPFFSPAPPGPAHGGWQRYSPESGTGSASFRTLGTASRHLPRSIRRLAVIRSLLMCMEFQFGGGNRQKWRQWTL